ncbi:MAG: DUF4386 domain-containing protein [Actinomycetes bacterium]
MAGFLDVFTALAGIGTAVALFPVLKRQNEGVALGFVTTRVLEAAIIFIGIASLLSLATLRDDLSGATGADEAALFTTGQSLVAIHDWTFLLGPGVMPGFNGLLLGYLMYQSGLVPRAPFPRWASSAPRCFSRQGRPEILTDEMTHVWTVPSPADDSAA